MIEILYLFNVLIISTFEKFQYQQINKGLYKICLIKCNQLCSHKLSI